MRVSSHQRLSIKYHKNSANEQNIFLPKLKCAMDLIEQDVEANVHCKTNSIWLLPCKMLKDSYHSAKESLHQYSLSHISISSSCLSFDFSNINNLLFDSFHSMINKFKISIFIRVYLPCFKYWLFHKTFRTFFFLKI